MSVPFSMNLAIMPTDSWSLCGSIISLWMYICVYVDTFTVYLTIHLSLSSMSNTVTHQLAWVARSMISANQRYVSVLLNWWLALSILRATSLREVPFSWVRGSDASDLVYELFQRNRNIVWVGERVNQTWNTSFQSYSSRKGTTIGIWVFSNS